MPARLLRSGGAAAPVKFHTLRREQQIPRPVDEVFCFFSDASNLEEITRHGWDFEP